MNTSKDVFPASDDISLDSSGQISIILTIQLHSHIIVFAMLI
jgi:hypothetical protein